MSDTTPSRADRQVEISAAMQDGQRLVSLIKPITDAIPAALRFMQAAYTAGIHADVAEAEKAKAEACLAQLQTEIDAAKALRDSILGDADATARNAVAAAEKAIAEQQERVSAAKNQADEAIEAVQARVREEAQAQRDAQARAEEAERVRAAEAQARIDDLTAQGDRMAARNAELGAQLDALRAKLA